MAARREMGNKKEVRAAAANIRKRRYRRKIKCEEGGFYYYYLSVQSRVPLFFKKIKVLPF